MKWVNVLAINPSSGSSASNTGYGMSKQTAYFVVLGSMVNLELIIW